MKQPTPARTAGAGRASLSRNAATNLTGLLIYLLVAFFLSPFIIRNLGDVRYGAWSLVAELVGYYTLFDFGLRAAVTYFVAHYLARGERDRLNGSICTAFWTLAAVGVSLALAGSAVALAFPQLFVKGQADPNEIVLAMMIMSATVGLSVPLEVFSAALSGCRRMDLVNASEITSRLLIAGGIYLALRSGGGLVAMAAIQAGGRILIWVLTYNLAQRALGGFSLRLSQVRRSELRALSGLGSMNVVINICRIVIGRSDLVVVGLFLGLKATAYYNIGRMVVEYASSINGSLTLAFTPHLTHLYSQGDRAGTKRLFLLGVRVSCLMALPLAACMFSFGRDFLKLWVGAAYVTGSVFQRSDVVLMVLLAAQLTRWPQSISWQLLYATGKYRVLVYLNMAEAVLNLGLSLALAKPLGLIGVALGTLIPMAASNLVAVPAHVLKRFEIPLREYIVQGIGRPAIVAVALYGFAQWMVLVWPPASWKALLIEGGLALTVEAALWLTVGLTREDREWGWRRIRPVVNGILGR